MRFDNLTAAQLERLLKCWSRNQEPPGDILSQICSDEAGDAGVAASIRLHDLVDDLVTRMLAGQRTQLGRTATGEDWQNALKNDFSTNSVTLEAWSALYFRYLHALQLPVGQLARTAAVADRQFRRRIVLGVHLLLQQLQNNEHKSGVGPPLTLRKQFIPQGNYLRLFGVEALIRRVKQGLTGPEGGQFFSLEGIGGIGKTTIAQAVANQLAEQSDYSTILWISARPDHLDAQGRIEPDEGAARTLDDIVSRMASQLGQDQLLGLPTPAKLFRLQPLLLGTPCLVVIDNLETTPDCEAVLLALQPLAGTSRFLLTSRVSLAELPFVQTLAVPELSRADSLRLLASEIGRRQDTLRATPAELEQIYAVVGGIPLALKLVASLTCHTPVDDVLAELGRCQGETEGRLFTYIYRQAWLGLDDTARQLLLSMLLISPDGEDCDWLRSNSGLSARDFRHGLMQLRDDNLVEVSGTLSRPLYRLHRLTISFLRTDILKNWREA